MISKLPEVGSYTRQICGDRAGDEALERRQQAAYAAQSTEYEIVPGFGVCTARGQKCAPQPILEGDLPLPCRTRLIRVGAIAQKQLWQLPEHDDDPPRAA